MIPLDCPENYPAIRRNLEFFLATYTHGIKYTLGQSIGTIKIIQPPNNKSNCAGYCLGNDEKKIDFKEAKNLLKQRIEYPSSGDIVFYLFKKSEAENFFEEEFVKKLEFLQEDSVFDNALYLPCHLGILREDERVISRWSEKAPVIDHKVWEVPLSFGDHIIFYKKPEIISPG